MSAFEEKRSLFLMKARNIYGRFRPTAVKGDDVDDRFHSLLFHHQLHSICQETIQVVYDVATDHCHYNFCSQKLVGFNGRDVL